MLEPLPRASANHITVGGVPANLQMSELLERVNENTKTSILHGIASQLPHEGGLPGGAPTEGGPQEGVLKNGALSEGVRQKDALERLEQMVLSGKAPVSGNTTSLRKTYRRQPTKLCSCSGDRHGEHATLDPTVRALHQDDSTGFILRARESDGAGSTVEYSYVAVNV